MRLVEIEFKNFRSLGSLTLRLEGASLIVVGANAIGKTALLEGIRLSLKGGVVVREDFTDPRLPISVVATLSDVPAGDHGVFANALDFTETPPVLRIGVRATWDATELEVSATHGFPDDAWRRVGREARDRIPLVFLGAERDPGRLAQTVGRSSLLANLLSGLAIDNELATALQQVDQAAADLSSSAHVQQLLTALDSELAKVLPATANGTGFSLGVQTTETSDVLRRFELLVGAGGPAAPLASQSSGVGQAALFALALAGVNQAPGAIMLVDEPEQRLHPQAQRALVRRLDAVGRQTVLTTHSSSVLDRLDPRRIARLHRGMAGTLVSRAQLLSDADAARLQRYSTSQTAEAFFAERVVFVEGFSDLLALRSAAQLLGLNLDAAGISLLSLEGKESFRHYLDLFGPRGLAVHMSGLCDEDAEADWSRRLTAAGVAITYPGSFNAAGFYVCKPDLEAELCSALGEVATESAIDADGGRSALSAFRGQPANQGRSAAATLEAFVKKDKIRWAPVLVEALTPATLPAPIRDLLSSL